MLGAADVVGEGLVAVDGRVDDAVSANSVFGLSPRRRPIHFKPGIWLSCTFDSLGNLPIRELWHPLVPIAVPHAARMTKMALSDCFIHMT